MRHVITIRLNQSAYQLDADAVTALQQYLADAARTLADDPDRDEILADLEQAIADKADALLGGHKNVVTTEEMKQILDQMGPVAGSAEPSAAAPGGDFERSAASLAPGPGPRRLYRLEEDKVLGGVCSGLAAYFGIDVVWVRVLWVLLTVFTGVWLLVYLAAVFIVPKASTAAERAQAHGQTLSTQELIDSARRHYAAARQSYTQYSSSLRRSARQVKRAAHSWRRQVRQQGGNALPGPSPLARVLGALLLPFFALASAALFVAVGLAIALLLSGATVHHWGLGTVHLPLWVGVAGLLLAYALIGLPLGAGHRLALHYANGGSGHGWANLWSAVIWLATATLLLWGLHETVPELRQLLEYLASHLRELDSDSHSLRL